MTKKNPYRRIEQLEARALAAARITREIPIIVINEGKPGAVSCVKGPDGRDVWWNPPEGHQCGELLAGDTHGGLHLDPAGFPGEIHILLVPAPNGRTSPLTTVKGPDGRLVWLNPPEGCKPDEPIEWSKDRGW